MLFVVAWIKNHYGEIPQGQAIIQMSLAQSLNLKEGDQVVLSADGTDLFRNFYRTLLQSPAYHYYYYLYHSSRSLPDEHPIPAFDMIHFPLKIYKIIDDFGGKLSQYEHQAIFVEFKNIKDHVSNYLNPLIPSSFVEESKRQNSFHWATQVLWNLPPSRVSTYLTTDSLQ